jgi:NADPH:quinone reductase-like Zn-dependent oxidoreductase
MAVRVMKAIRAHTREGTKSIVQEDAPIPPIAAGEALVRVHAAGITPTEFTWNSTYTTKEGRDRLPTIPGFEVSGIVERLGPGVTGLSEGDAVFGLLDFWRDGAAAEFVAARAKDLAPKPASLDHVHAAAVPLSGLTAWQALFDHAGLSASDRLLIHGAAGGVGSFAVQLARWRGTHVLATASRSKVPFLRALGAAEVIDYTVVRFEDRVRNVDVVLDTVGGETLDRSWSVLRPGGVLVTIAGDAPADLAAKHGVRGISFLVQPNRDQLLEMTRLLDAGTVRPIVDAVLPLARAREAYERGLVGHNRGKIVLQVADSGPRS